METVQKCKKAFALIVDEDTQYFKHFEEERGLGKPIADDWGVVEICVEFLKVFYDWM